MPLDYSRVTLSEPLWTVDQVKLHLRITGTDHDADITQKRDAAQEEILAYLNLSADPTWTAATAPLLVKHAIHFLTAHYYEHRGDDPEAAADGMTAVWAHLQNMLKMYRDPTLA